MKYWIVRNKDGTLEAFTEKPHFNGIWQSVDSYGTISYGKPINIKTKLTFNRSPKLLNINKYDKRRIN